MTDRRIESVATSTTQDTNRLWNSVVGGDFSFVLARASYFSLLHVNRVLASYGLHARSYSLLALSSVDLRPSQRELSDFLCLDPRQIVMLVDDLEARGLVQRTPDPSDRRVNVIVATAEGRRLHDLARSAAVVADEESLSRIAPKDLDRAERALRVLAQAPAQS